MAQIYDGSDGTADDDYIFGLEYYTGTSSTLNGEAGDDFILGDINFFHSVYASQTNNDIASAYSLDDNDPQSYAWTTDENPLIANSTTIPHATVYVEATAGEPEYFAITLQAGQTLTADIDLGYGTPVNSSIDTKATLYDAGGNLVASDDDSLVTAGGEGSLPYAPGSPYSYDPYLTYTATATGTYYIAINPFSGTFAGTEAFLLNLSVTGHATDPDGNTPVDSNTINGGAGNDLLFGAAGNDTIDGGDDNDIIDGGSGTDTITGGAGNDTIIWAPGGGSDSIDGGGDIDDLDLTRATTAWTVNLTTGTATDGTNTLSLANVESVDGTAFADTLYSGDGDSGTVSGLGGDDHIYVGGSYSVLDGGGGTDTIDLSGFNGPYDVNLATGDTTFTSDGEHFYNFENFNGADGANTVTGTSGNNIINTKGGNDTINAGDGNDTLNGGAGDDTINGEGGTDTVTYADATAGVTVSLAVTTAQATGGSGSDTLSGIENLFGSAFNDNLTGDAGNNYLRGLAGGDNLTGGAGNDILDGSGGYDRVIYTDATNGVTVDLNIVGQQNTGWGMDSLVGIEAVNGSSYNDTLIGNGMNNELKGGIGNDVLVGGGGNDILNGGANFDTADYSSAAIGVHVNLSTATAQNTGQGSDTLTSIEAIIGSAFNDILTGSNVANTLIGGNGIDKLDGGLGSDSLTGGAGTDRFYFTTTLGSSNIDTITDFTVGSDKMYLDHNVFMGLTAGPLAAGAFNTGTSATQADDRIIYNSSTGALYFDKDGLGGAAQVQFATLSTGLTTLSSTSFQVV